MYLIVYLFVLLRETEAVLVQTMPQQTSMLIMTPASQHKATATMSKERYNSSICKWCARVDTETNTHSNKSVMHNKTFSTPNYDSSVTSSDKATHNSSTKVHCKNFFSKTARSANDRLVSPTRLSRYIEQTSSGDQTDVNQDIANSVLSSDLDAANWIKRCTTQGKDYQSLSDMDDSTLKALTQASFSLKKSSKATRSQTPSKINTINKSNLCYSMNKVLSPSRFVTSQSDDSLSDLPVTTLPKPRNECVPERESKQTVDKVTSDSNLPVETIPKSLSKVAVKESKQTADKNTSDTLVKHLKETILQTCPDIKEAATCTITPNTERQKSASAITSKCVLPSPRPCCHNKNISKDCLFVYERPRCVIHRTRVDVSVQSHFLQNYDIVTKRHDAQDCGENAVVRPHSEYPQRFTHREVSNSVISKLLSPKETVTKRHGAQESGENAVECPHSEYPESLTHREVSNSAISELLSPKAYKELYERTKLAVEDQNVCPVRDTGMESSFIEVQNAASEKALSTRSAGMVTSKFGMSQSNMCCQPMITATSKQAEIVYAYNTPEPSNQTCTTWYARLLDIPTYDDDGKKKDYVGELEKSHLVESCRHYSNLLTKHFGLVREKVTKRLAPPDEQYLYLSTASSKPLKLTEEFTMKPSGRRELECQTSKARKSRSHVKQDLPKPLSRCVLSPSLTNICEGQEQHHLKSVYYMLSAIEGRIRRLKRNVSG